jgi:hypothetical protein
MTRYLLDLDRNTVGALDAWCAQTGLKPESALAILLGLLVDMLDEEAPTRVQIQQTAVRLRALLDHLEAGARAQQQAAGDRRQATETSGQH